MEELFKSILPLFHRWYDHLWGVGGDPVSECVIEDAFSKTFSQESCKISWSKVGATPLIRKYSSNSKVAHEIGYGE